MSLNTTVTGVDMKDYLLPVGGMHNGASTTNIVLHAYAPDHTWICVFIK